MPETRKAPTPQEALPQEAVAEREHSDQIEIPPHFEDGLGDEMEEWLQKPPEEQEAESYGLLQSMAAEDTTQTGASETDRPVEEVVPEPEIGASAEHETDRTAELAPAIGKENEPGKDDQEKEPSKSTAYRTAQSLKHLRGTPGVSETSLQRTFDGVANGTLSQKRAELLSSSFADRAEEIATVDLKDQRNNYLQQYELIQGDLDKLHKKAEQEGWSEWQIEDEAEGLREQQSRLYDQYQQDRSELEATQTELLQLSQDARSLSAESADRPTLTAEEVSVLRKELGWESTDETPATAADQEPAVQKSGETSKTPTNNRAEADAATEAEGTQSESLANSLEEADSAGSTEKLLEYATSRLEKMTVEELQAELSRTTEFIAQIDEQLSDQRESLATINANIEALRQVTPLFEGDEASAEAISSKTAELQAQAEALEQKITTMQALREVADQYQERIKAEISAREKGEAADEQVDQLAAELSSLFGKGLRGKEMQSVKEQAREGMSFMEILELLFEALTGRK